MNKSVSPINGGELSSTNISGILKGDYDNIFYKVIEEGKIIPLKSPINGGELSPISISGIFKSDYEGLLYKVTNDGKIIPLKGPHTNGKLTVNQDGILYDEYCNRYYLLDENNKIVENIELNKPIIENEKKQLEYFYNSRNTQRNQDEIVRNNQLSLLDAKNNVEVTHKSFR